MVNATGTPGKVADLSIASVDTTSATLTFTQVDDGTGQPAQYDVRYASPPPIAWGSATAITSGTCTTPVSGTAIGSALTCTVLGLIPSTKYDVQVVAFRGTLSQNAVFGALSNIVSATTAASGQAPVASVTVAPASASVGVGSTVQLGATTRDASNNILTGRIVTWTTSNSAVATVSTSGVVTGIAAGTALVTATSEGVSGTSAITVSAPSQPGTVTNLGVSAIDSNAVVLSFTQVDDGTGQPASYEMRYSSPPIVWGFATATTSGTCQTPISGTAIGTALICKVLGLKSGTKYDFQVSAFRGTLNLNAVFGSLSNVVSLTTTSSAPPPPVAVASVSVALASSSLIVGQTTQATATTRDSNNNVLTGRVIAWSSSNTGVATVSGSGLVTAVAVGTAQITATSEGHSGNASLTVIALPPVPVASVTVALDASSLSPGLTTQARATTRDASGNVLTGRSISWSSSNGGVAMVSSAGLVTAVAVGSVQITASSEGQSGSATLNVVQAPPPPPTSGWPNEPAGMTVFTDRAFNAINEDPAWDDYQPGTIVQDPTAPRSPPNVWRVTYPAGFAAGSAPNAAGTGVQTGHLLSYHTIYMAWWMKYSSNWYSNPVANKVCYLWAQNNLKPFYFSTMGTDLVPYINTQQWIAGGNGQPNQNLAPDLAPSTRIVRDQWTLIEIVAVGNSAGTADGSLDWYVNGVHVGTVSGVQYTSGSTDWYIMDLAPVWGGVVGVVPATQTMDIDHFYISGKN